MAASFVARADIHPLPLAFSSSFVSFSFEAFPSPLFQCSARVTIPSNSALTGPESVSPFPWSPVGFCPFFFVCRYYASSPLGDRDLIITRCLFLFCFRFPAASLGLFFLDSFARLFLVCAQRLVGLRRTCSSRVQLPLDGRSFAVLNPCRISSSSQVGLPHSPQCARYDFPDAPLSPSRPLPICIAAGSPGRTVFGRDDFSSVVSFTFPPLPCDIFSLPFKLVPLPDASCHFPTAAVAS